jgi:hypothetical protein
MSHEWMHLNIFLMKNCIRKDPFIILLAILPFSHPNQSMPFHVTWNALASSFHGKMHGRSFIGHPPIQPFQLIDVFSCHIGMHLPRRPMGKFMGNLSLSILLAILPFSHLDQSMPFHATWGKPFATSSHGEMQSNVALVVVYVLSLLALLFTFSCSKP